MKSHGWVSFLKTKIVLNAVGNEEAEEAGDKQGAENFDSFDVKQDNSMHKDGFDLSIVRTMIKALQGTV